MVRTPSVFLWRECALTNANQDRISREPQPEIQRQNPKGKPWKLRLWPGIALALLFLFFKLVLPIFYAEAGVFSVLGGAVIGLALVIWWAIFSKAPSFERWGALALIVAAFFIAFQLIDPTLKITMMGMMFPLFAFPTFFVALVGWAWVSQKLSVTTRRLALVATIALVALIWSNLRVDGMWGEASLDFAWRWSKTTEDRLVADADSTKNQGVSSLATMTRQGQWFGFRGGERDGVVSQSRINPDWKAAPPKELWRKSVGPAASSFAVRGDVFFTQEQRGEEEWVTCYDVATGALIWRHSDTTRFADSHTGPGPRATPTLADHQIVTLGASGRLNVLDASSGQVIWSRDAAKDAKEDIPSFGFSGSPLVLDDIVVAALSGKLVAYDRGTGEPRWFGPDNSGSYSSPKLFSISGVPQILFTNYAGLTSISPQEGTHLWTHEWIPKARVAMPYATGDGGLLLSGGERTKLRRLNVNGDSGKWQVEEDWTSMRLRPYHSDIVVHRGHAYGFDGSILTCVDVATGERRWKGGRYGAGQILLLKDQDLIFALTEKGELKLVSAKPDGFQELASFPALKGKTWNHPVIVDDLLLVRNIDEMMAFQLPQLENTVTREP